MNPSIRRYLPVVAGVGLLLVAVYFGQPDRMTGSAAGAGCAGGQGQLVTENEAGAVTKSALDSVRAIVSFDSAAAEAGEMASLDELKATVEEMGIDAVPALLEELRDSGCMTANSATLIDLVQILGEQPDFDGELYGVISDTLLDVAVMALDDASSRPEPAMTASLANDGKGDEPTMTATLANDGEGDEPTMEATDAAEGGRTFECAIDALDVVQGWSSAKTDSSELVKRILESMDSLSPGSKASVELVELLAELAPRDDEWSEIFENMAVDQELDKDARGLACDAAVERDSSLLVLRNDLSALTSPAAAVCLIEASTAFEDSSYAAWGLKHEEVNVRLASLGVLSQIGDDDDIEMLLTHLFTAPGTELRGFDDVERGAAIKAIAVIVSESDKEAAELLVGAIDFSTQAAEIGATWLAALDQAVDNWEATIEEEPLTLARLLLWPHLILTRQRALVPAVVPWGDCFSEAPG
jgi:hypothetical protein